jgi:LacI family transcriptional regulator
MKNVAELAGVSISSVSHVINKTRRVEHETKRKILDAVEKLNYTPNLFARSLKGKGTKLLGVIIADIRDSFFAEVMKSIEFNALERGYNVILCDSENEWEKEQMHLNTFISKGLDGIIFSPADTQRVNANLIAANIPFVQIDRKIEQYNADFVGIDNLHSSRAATEFLIQQGCRHIGYIGFSNSVYTQNQRQQGCRDTLEAHNLYDETLILRLPYHDRRKYRNLRDYFAEHPEIQGLVCCNNNCCYEAFLEIERIGKNIPEDIKLVTYDDSKWFDFLKYPVSVVVQPTEAIGRLAVDCIIGRIEDESEPVRKEIILDTEFIPRP